MGRHGIGAASESLHLNCEWEVGERVARPGIDF